MRRALVAAGGGAKGAFQVGALLALARHGFTEWSHMFGVSVGSILVGALDHGLTPAEIAKLWQNLDERDVHERYGWAKVALRVLQRQSGIYDNTPLLRFLRRTFAGRIRQGRASVGYVSLMDGAYIVGPATPENIRRSCTMPVVWEIADHEYVDGGVRNVTPLGDAVDEDVDEIFVLLCNPLWYERTSSKPRHIIDAATRSLDVAMHEIARGDIDEFLRVNELVRQAEQFGVTLRRRDGTPYRYIPITIIAPSRSLGDTLDFSRSAIEERIAWGQMAAEDALATREVA